MDAEKRNEMKRVRINAVYKKELMIGMRSMKTALTLLGYNGLLALIGLITLYVVYENARYGGLDNSDILGMYTVLVVMEFGLILFVIPAYTASAIAGERERQTLEILLTTTMKPIQIILGKLLSSISTVLLLVFSSLPVLSLVFSVGGVSMGDVAEYVVLIVVTAIYAGSFGLLFSALFKKTTISTVMTYAILLILGAGTVALLLIIYFLLQMHYQNLFHSGAISGYITPDLGYGVCLLLINPALSIMSLLFGQFSSMGVFSDVIGELGTVPTFLTDHWFGISMIVQLMVSAGVLALAAHVLNPLHRKEEGKRTKRKRKNKGKEKEKE